MIAKCFQIVKANNRSPKLRDNFMYVYIYLALIFVKMKMVLTNEIFLPFLNL
jgi:hypothetical protein